MGLHYDNPDPLENAALRTQRMTADEAASVIALWQQERVEQTGLTDRPAVPDVAEGLDVPVEEVQRLLSAVRARRLEEERALAQEQAQVHLAQEVDRLAAIRLQRAELGLVRAEVMQQAPDQWQRPVPQTRLRRGKHKQAVPSEWTGNEEFWKETEADKEARAAYRASRAKRTTRYMLYTILLLLLACFGSFLLMSLAGWFMLRTQ